MGSLNVDRRSEEKQARLFLGISCLTMTGYDPKEFMNRLVTRDETWVHHLDPESKKQNMQWKHPGLPAPKKFKRGFVSREGDGLYLLG